ncbi:hypothetical protein WR25_05216 [Diploscapter pachys]|uniref:Uncharacterized protein n=1 Tax=Diploscapter pachys TaxID=2018661 RepID=A0A2A2K158_9BILA|nr:hypothetical protein WR25_05216 [Diploscapter pachys]
MRDQLRRVLLVGAHLARRDAGRAAHHGAVACQHPQDRVGARMRVALGIDLGEQRLGDFRGAAAIGHDQRRAACQRLGGHQPERLRPAAMDIGVRARHDRREAAAVVDRAEQTDVRIGADVPFQRLGIHALAQDDEADRRLRADAADRVDHRRPALFGMVAPDAEQQVCVRRQPALLEQRDAERLVAQAGREMRALDPQRHRRIDAHAARAQLLGQRRAVGDDRVVLVETVRQIAIVPRKRPLDPRRGGEGLEPALRIGFDIVVVQEERTDRPPLPLRDDPGRAPR